MTSSLHARFTEGRITSHLWEMAWPMIWGLIATMSFNAVDAYFVGRLGEEALAAMGFTFPVVMVVTSVAIGLGAGASSSISRALGAGNHQQVQRLATDAISLSTLISITVCLLGWLTIDPLFTLMGAGPELLPMIRDYMAIWYLSAPFLLVPMIGLSALRALGFHRIQGILMVAAALLNALLDPILIFGWGPVPRLEIEGAAWATLITRVLTLIVAVYVLGVRQHVLVSPLAAWRDLKRSWGIVFHVGLPAILSNLIVPVAAGIVLKLVAVYGTSVVAGLSAAVRIEPLALIVFYALSGVVGPFCGQNKGAGHYHRLFDTISIILKFCLGFGLFAAVVLWFGGGFLGRFFVETDEALNVITTYLMVVPISYGAYGLVMSVNAIFNGLGQPLPGLVISFLRVLGVFLPFALLGMWLWGLTGLFVATAAANCVVAAIAYLWLLRLLRQEARLQEVPTLV